MSSLKQQLKNDVVAHMKAGNKVALATIRNVLGEVETKEKSGKTPVEFDDAALITLLQKEALKRHESATIYADAGEAGRAAAEIAEAQVIEGYLPQPLTEAQARAIVQEVIAEQVLAGDPLTMRQMGQVMKPVQAKIAGRFDGKAISEMVRAQLA
ncbi:GatB/YqeY domain-containing protein [Arthrobacter cryoconiti]|uniref:GatB/YqeY domain-containing protein n=1 Tax=Arthrobacter cryoconiti TaxID=748907 RepID=A0ABV8QV01_9MICC|nr:GatB/YqeY domain-containing protein [Arthrobacter cryoconiti]MCC9069664.1 GatB/YqeY domain-containing protein [Arthrobacter cryoconiti]